MRNVDGNNEARQFTVLVVEDESAVRDIVAEILTAGDLKVLLAADGYEALRLLSSHEVDVLLTDIMMPGLTGYELALRARRIHPMLRILYTTGNDDGAAGREMALSYGKVIPKPVHAGALVREIRQLLPR